MSERYDPKAIAFGEPYGDGSGWEWRIQVSQNPDGTWSADGEGLFSGLYASTPQEVPWRVIARAFEQIADAFGHDLIGTNEAQALRDHPLKGPEDE